MTDVGGPKVKQLPHLRLRASTAVVQRGVARAEFFRHRLLAAEPAYDASVPVSKLGAVAIGGATLLVLAAAIAPR